MEFEKSLRETAGCWKTSRRCPTLNATMTSHERYRMKYPLLLAFFLAATLTAPALAQSTSAGEPNPIVGSWRWVVNRGLPGLTTIRVDGTVTNVNHNGPKWRWTKGDGKWRALPATTEERQYEILWGDGNFVDKLALSRDGMRLYGQNNVGFKIWADRVTEDAAQDSQ